MKIRSIRAIPVHVPVSPPRVSSLGTFNGYDYAVVIIETDSGLQGIGEISTLWDGTSAVQCVIVEHVLAPALIGLDPRRINVARRRMEMLKESGLPARAGIEMALFDLAGKALGAPVHDLLGGMTRERVTLSRSIHMAPLEQLRANAQQYVADGFGCVKVKVGRSIDDDVAAVAAVRDAVGPQTLIRVDANMSWRSAKEAAHHIARLSEFDLHSVEQPIAPGHIEEMKLLRGLSAVPIMADESVWGAGEAWELLRQGAVDLLNVYVAESGGLAEAALIFRMAELAGVNCVIGAMPELGIGTSAAVHLGVSVGVLDDPCDASGAMYQQHDVIHERFDIVDGTIAPLPGPGLGVTLDLDRVEEFAVRPGDRSADATVGALAR